MLGYYRVAAAIGMIEVGNVEVNLELLSGLYRRAADKGAACVLFPELALSGATCGDLFFQEDLLRAALRAAHAFARATDDTIAVFGLPLAIGDNVYNACAVAGNGAIRAWVLADEGTPESRRWFAPGRCCPVETFDGAPVIHGEAVFSDGQDFSFSVAIGQAARMASGGAALVLHPAAVPVLPGSCAASRRKMEVYSLDEKAAYCFCASGCGESTTDAVYSSQIAIADQGRILAENGALNPQAALVFADIDFVALRALRRRDPASRAVPGTLVALATAKSSPDFAYAHLERKPFVPDAGRCREVLAIQAMGLARRMQHVHARRMVLGVSGGLDSTLALLVAVRACALNGRPASDVLAVTMPGFGTTGRTYRNALTMCQALGVEIREIPIKAACLAHFDDIGHDPAQLDVTFENAQARERTQILMDLANKCQGLVVGTGDLSEIALGWSTYNGDHMSMYAVNASVPKSLIPALLTVAAEDVGNPVLAAALADVAATPVSPELLPPNSDGEIAQVTEQLIGSYELHDFFLYHFIRHNAGAEKLYRMALAAFDGCFEADEIARVLQIFLRRFRQQQFKRNCMPDGAQATGISLSPRGGWCMPSDAGIFSELRK